MTSNKNQAVLLGLLSALFFSFTFIFNRLMAVNGGSWIWSASLRFLWMLPIFFLIVFWRKNLGQLLKELQRHPIQWLLWSTVGFGLFYSTLTYAAAYGPSWLIAGTWQITIVAGLLLSPLLSQGTQTKGIPFSSFLYSALILLGIGMMQLSQAENLSIKELGTGTLPVIVAAFAFPLGNRKMMQLVDGRLDAYQRILGMLIGSLPFWILLVCVEWAGGQGLPSSSQALQTLAVAISSGLIATALFFSATNQVRKDEKSLAAVEATQASEVVFSLIGELVIFSPVFPGYYTLAGIGLVVLGMLLHSRKN
ncbi:multidrug resistance efflux transporter family protein [Algoriphagus sp. H41]|uniref:Multidrug resistance efflux transporter family protein n=1 Tax=Algoriphagus oliviformis TaxID=2811231 RepID=A0ABS3C422_9BACT|nr:multidrug resistance efflux transporter family protein [Algoriphagus oliviformis]MBN7811842.1 multidrug resistance efflux transporter family protein [Algoriphagus oliviformis]